MSSGTPIPKPRVTPMWVPWFDENKPFFQIGLYPTKGEAMERARTYIYRGDSKYGARRVWVALEKN